MGLSLLSFVARTRQCREEKLRRSRLVFLCCPSLDCPLQVYFLCFSFAFPSTHTVHIKAMEGWFRSHYPPSTSSSQPQQHGKYNYICDTNAFICCGRLFFSILLTLVNCVVMSPLTRILTLALLAVLSFQAVNAQSLSDGKYWIVPAASSDAPIGFNEQGTRNPVVVGGENNVWTVRKLDQEEYQIILEEAGPIWFTQAAENNVFVSRAPLPTTWRVQIHEGNTYSIEVPSIIRPTRAWTLDSTAPGNEVTLEIFEPSGPGQLWIFTRVPNN